jgi:hypothetical protein
MMLYCQLAVLVLSRMDVYVSCLQVLITSVIEVKRHHSSGCKTLLYCPYGSAFLDVLEEVTIQR